MYLGTLKEFQLEGAKFLANKRRAICAFDVGLGKTHIAMACNEKLREYRGIERTLIVCPNYLKWKWAYELDTWTDNCNVVIDGTPKHRQAQIGSFSEGYLIVNYELLLQDFQELLSYNFNVIIADEVTRIKNFKSKTKAALNRFRPDYRWGLTGTPVSNYPDELYSIMGWVDGNLFGKWYDFDQQYIIRNRFGGVDRYVNLQKLAGVSSKRMISMTQEEVGEGLPEVIIENLPLSFTPKQEKLYNEVALSLEGYLDVMVSKLLSDEELTGEEAKIRERINALRMVCICPRLLQGSGSKYIKKTLEDFNDDGGKVTALFKIIEDKVWKTNDKMVIFSFYRGLIPIIEEYLKEKKIGYLTLMGGMDARDTQNNIELFHNDPNKQIFLTTEAGDKGIDLQAAKYLVNMDIPPSWEKYEQRLGRVKRLYGKHKSVIVYNLMMKGSFEERQLQRTLRKGELSEVIRGKSNIDTLKPVDQSLRQFLKGE
jgi:SNF2 family DNA or RNA helicase